MPKTPTRPRRVRLVLGSGGARGYAHIGVIQELLARGHEIVEIAGASMGALVGGIHAAGQLPTYTEWVSALQRNQVLRLIDPGLGSGGFIKGERLMAVLRELLGEHRIEDLPLAFTAVATDADSGDEVWLRKGDLFSTLRASIAMPMVFAPARLDGRWLLDGALVNPLPVSALRRARRGTLTLAVNLVGPVEPLLGRDTGSAAEAPKRSRRLRDVVDELLLPPLPSKQAPEPPPPRLVDMAFIGMQAMADTVTRLKLAQCAPDLIINIPRNACGFHEFWRARELIQLGRERAAALLDNARPDGND